MLSYRPTCILFLIVSADLAYAQDSGGQLGPFPPGVVTLLASLWVGLSALSESRFDVLFPVVFARILHRIPLLKQLLASDARSGSLVKQIVLMSDDHPGRSISQEWDTLILKPTAINRSVHGQPVHVQLQDIEGSLKPEVEGRPSDPHEMQLQLQDNEAIFDFYIKMGAIDMVKLEGAIRVLLKGLDFAEGKPPRVHMVLRLWHALRMYQQYPEQVEWGAYLEKWELDGAILNYREHMESRENPLKIEDSLAKTKFKVHYPDSKYAANEVSEGATTLKASASAKHLAVMLAFTEHVCGKRTVQINPLILCVWIWKELGLHPDDNLLFRLPPSHRFSFHPTPNDLFHQTSWKHFWLSPRQSIDPQSDPPKPADMPKNALDLSVKGWEIDGGHSRRLWFFGLWCLSLLLVSIIAFLAIIAGGTTPNMAATFALLLVWPCTIDSYRFGQAGYPPSWNGHQQIRWARGWACSVFRGRFYRTMGPSGNSIFRATLAYAVAWVSWHFRLQLRKALAFSSIPAPPSWVIIVAIVLEVASISLCLVNIITHIFRRQFKSAGAMAILTSFIIYNLVALIRSKNRENILLSELSLLAAVPYAAIIPRGVGPSYKPFVLYNCLLWCHIVALSAVPMDRAP